MARKVNKGADDALVRHRLCPENPGAWELHEVFHKKVREQRKVWEDGGGVQRLNHESGAPQSRATSTMR